MRATRLPTPSTAPPELLDAPPDPSTGRREGALPDPRALVETWPSGGSLEALAALAIHTAVEACAEHLELHARKLDGEGALYADHAHATRWAATLLRRLTPP